MDRGVAEAVQMLIHFTSAEGGINMQQVPTILIIDSNSIFRRALKDIILDRFPGMHIVEAGNAREGLQHAVEAKPQLVVTDLYLEGSLNLSMLRQIARRQPKTHIAVLTDLDEEEYRRAALEQGADDFISKSGPNSQRVLAVIQNHLSPA